MAESTQLTIQQVFEARHKWRAASIAPLSPELIRTINEIRAEVKSSQMGRTEGSRFGSDFKSGHGRQESNQNSFRGNGKPQGRNTHGYDKKYNGHSGGGGAGGGSWNQGSRWSKPEHSQPYVPTVPATMEPTSVKKLVFYNSALPKVETTTPAVSAEEVVKPEKTALELSIEKMAATPKDDSIKSHVRQQLKPRFTNSDIVKDNSPHEIMLLQIQLAINKLVDTNYDHLKRLLRSFLRLGHDNEYLKRFMGMIFSSAVRDHVNCHLFAKLLYEMSQEHVFLQTEMNNKYDEFISSFFRNIEPVYPTDTLDVSDIKLRNDEKRRGYSQFITELLKFNVIEDTYFLNIIKQIIDTIEVQSKDIKYKKSIIECTICLNTIMEVLYGTNDYESYNRIRAIIKDTYNDVLKKMSNLSSLYGPGMSKQGALTILNICDLFAKPDA